MSAAGSGDPARVKTEPRVPAAPQVVLSHLADTRRSLHIFLPYTFHTAGNMFKGIMPGKRGDSAEFTMLTAATDAPVNGKENVREPMRPSNRAVNGIKPKKSKAVNKQNEEPREVIVMDQAFDKLLVSEPTTCNCMNASKTAPYRTTSRSQPPSVLNLPLWNPQ
jgi:hypothetical protein